MIPSFGDYYSIQGGQSLPLPVFTEHPQIALGGGYDHCWVLDANGGESELQWAISARDTVSGRVLEVATTEPAVQFYTGNFLNGSFSGKYGTVYQKRFGLCFEPEHYPDSPNQSEFPSVVLNPGDIYQTTTIWRFSVTPQ